jgi:hypothetical protein
MIPLVELINLRDYKDIDNIFGYSVLFIPFCMARVLFLFEKKSTKLELLFIYIYFAIFLMNVSRIITFCLLFVIGISYLAKNKNKIRIAVLAMCAIFVFGLMGEIRSSGSRNSGKALVRGDSVIAYLSEPTQSFYQLGLDDSILWFYIYSVSPIYNLNNALIKPSTAFSYDLLVKSISPNFVYSRIFDIEKDKSFLVEDTFNTSTIYGETAYNSGMISAIFYHVFICMYVLLISVVTRLQNSTAMNIFVSVFFVMSIFSGLIFKEIFLITLMFSGVNFLLTIRRRR